MSSKILGGEIRKGMVIVYNGKLCKVNETMHVKPGKGGAFAQVSMHAIKEGTKFNVRFRTSETVEKAFIEGKALTLAYKDGDFFVFMDEQSEELRLKEDELGVRADFLTEGCIVNGDFHDEVLIGLSWPAKSSVQAKVVEAEKYLKGSTATQKEKPAILDNGARVIVPCYVETGQTIEVNPEDGSFIQVV